MSFHKQTKVAVVVAIAGLLLAACGGGGAGLSPGPAAGSQNNQSPIGASPVLTQTIDVPLPQPIGGALVGNKILEFPTTASGNVPPSITIAGSNTQLNDPGATATDSKGNLYVTNVACCAPNATPCILVYAPGATGNAAPIRSICGPNTTLNVPDGIALDGADNIFVANSRGGASPGLGSIIEFSAGAEGNVAPIATISGPHTGLNIPLGIALDANRNIYVTNFNACNPNGSPAGSVTVYAAGSSGDVAPMGTISGVNTRLLLPSAITLDASGNVFVSNNGQLVTVYAAGQFGNIAPLRTISIGSSAGGLAFDATGNLYVSTDLAINVYAPGASGNATPLRTITGSNTGLTVPVFISIH